jgi:hypothetical protein
MITLLLHCCYTVVREWAEEEMRALTNTAFFVADRPEEAWRRY